MKTEIFKTKREFDKKFPSKIYICSRCGQLTPNPDICIFCAQQANTLLLGINDNYSYIIEEKSREIKTIFRPIELTERTKNEHDSY